MPIDPLGQIPLARLSNGTIITAADVEQERIRLHHEQQEDVLMADNRAEYMAMVAELVEPGRRLDNQPAQPAKPVVTAKPKVAVVAAPAAFSKAPTPAAPPARVAPATRATAPKVDRGALWKKAMAKTRRAHVDAAPTTSASSEKNTTTRDLWRGAIKRSATSKRSEVAGVGDRDPGERFWWDPK